jgi:hypothetical protein
LGGKKYGKRIFQCGRSRDDRQTGKSHLHTTPVSKSEIEGQSFTFEKPIRYKHTDPVKGELYQPLPFVPPVTVNTAPGILLFRKNKSEEKKYTYQ